MATALTLKQAIAAVWQKFMGVIGYADISGIGDGTVKGAIAGLNGKSQMYFTAPNTEEITIPSKGYVQTSLYLPEIQGKYIVNASIIGARTPSYVPQIYIAGVSRQGTTDVNVYLNLYNAYTSSLSNTFQVGIWYADEP